MLTLSKLTVLAQVGLSPLYTGVDSQVLFLLFESRKSVAKSAAVMCSLAGMQFSLPPAHCSGICPPQRFVTLLFSVS